MWVAMLFNIHKELPKENKHTEAFFVKYKLFSGMAKRAQKVKLLDNKTQPRLLPHNFA